MSASLTLPVLVLDAGYQAVNVIPVRRALALLATGKAVTVEEDEDLVYRSERLSFRCPVIIRLFMAVAHRVYRTLKVKFNKKNIMARDGYQCQYCGAHDVPLTIDHVFPRSRRDAEHPQGGVTSWENCVTACLDCNARKGNRTPEEAGMALRTRPGSPRWFLPLLHRKPAAGSYVRWRKYLFQ
jgi:5-methylcytosine-specific restriction endonuclease McrA